MQKLDLNSVHLWQMCKLVFLHVGSLASGAGAVSDSVLCQWVPFSLPGLPDWASVGEGVAGPAGTWYTRVGGTPEGLPFSGEDIVGRRNCQGRTRSRGRKESCDWDLK